MTRQDRKQRAYEASGRRLKKDVDTDIGHTYPLITRQALLCKLKGKGEPGGQNKLEGDKEAWKEMKN